MDSSRNEKIFAGSATAIIAIIAIVLLLMVTLRFPPRDWEEKHPPEEQSELLFGGEYVILGDIPTPADNGAQAPETAPDGTDLSNEGVAGESAPLVTSEQPSTMTVAKQPEAPKNPGPSAEELAKQEAQKRIGNRVQFGSSGSDASGQQGSSNGNASTGALSGQPGHNLSGRTIQHYEVPDNRTAVGTVEVTVSVNRDGKVTSAHASGGTPPAASNAAVRRSCEQASLRLVFSSSATAPATQTGVITWKIK
jgi:outer membrane biosynthesis protein TonB